MLIADTLAEQPTNNFLLTSFPYQEFTDKQQVYWLKEKNSNELTWHLLTIKQQITFLGKWTWHMYTLPVDLVKVCLEQHYDAIYYI